MKADLTRVTFDPSKHFSRVLMQQGRVQLDADWNEQGAIFLNYLRRLGADVFGLAGGPADSLGFTIGIIDPKLAPNAADFLIGPGHYYVDGILCEAATAAVALTSDKDVLLAPGDAWTMGDRLLAKDDYGILFDAAPGTAVAPLQTQVTSVDYGKRTIVFANMANFFGKKPAQPRFARHLTYLTQTDLPNAAPAVAGLVYLDVWERAITYVQDDSIREVALNGPDTAARAKVVWQVRILDKATECMSPQEIADALFPPPHGRLRAMAKPKPADTDPCTISPEARYRGMENQLYRVEIHTGNVPGGDKPTFKWSRENGSVVFPIVSGSGTSRLVLESLGRDDRFGLAEGDLVEYQDDTLALSNGVLPLLRVNAIERGARAVQLSDKVTFDPAKHPLLRRWDQKFGGDRNGGKEGADHAVLIPASATEWLDLEDGVQVQFVDSASANYRSGDYWLIPARVATGDVEWPRETVPGNPPSIEPIARFPSGVTHRYAPLGVIDVSGKTVSVSGECRFQIAPAAAVKLPGRAGKAARA